MILRVKIIFFVVRILLLLFVQAYLFLTRFYYRDSFSRWICTAFFLSLQLFLWYLCAILSVSVTPVLVASRRCFYRTSESSFAAIIPNLFYYSFLPFSGNQLQLLFSLIGEQLSFFLTYQLCPLLLYSCSFFFIIIPFLLPSLWLKFLSPGVLIPLFKPFFVILRPPLET